jgi:hypothetical protein
VIELEGLITDGPRARELGAGMMSLDLTLSPWRRRGSPDTERSTIAVSIEMDLDLADAWMRVLDHGNCVRIVCASLTETTDANGKVHVRCNGLLIDECSNDCLAHSWSRESS